MTSTTVAKACGFSAALKVMFVMLQIPKPTNAPAPAPLQSPASNIMTKFELLPILRVAKAYKLQPTQVKREHAVSTEPTPSTSLSEPTPNLRTSMPTAAPTSWEEMMAPDIMG